MNFRGTKKLILMVSHDHWVRNQKKLFSMGFKKNLSPLSPSLS